MARAPTERSVGLLGTATNAQFVQMIAGTVVDGDLLLATLGCDVASNGNMGAGWTRFTEVATGGFTASLFVRWGVAADSGATFVCSYSGAGGANTLKHGFITTIQDVSSKDLTGVLHQLKTWVNSNNYIATASYQTDSTSDTAWASLIQGDNIAVNSTGFVSAGWTFVASRGTSVGNDGQQYLLKRTAADSGTFINPASSALGTSHEWRAFTFGLDAEAETFTNTVGDVVSAVETSGRDFDETLQFRWFGRVNDDPIEAVQDEPLTLRELLRRHSDEFAFDDGNDYQVVKVRDVAELLELLDSMTADKVSSEVIVSYVGEDAIEMDDGTERTVMLFRLYESNLELVDERHSASVRVLWSTDTLAVAPDDADFIANTNAESLLELFDEMTAEKSGLAIFSDAIEVYDDSVRVVLLSAQVMDALVVADETQYARLRSLTTEDGTSLTDALLSFALRGSLTVDTIEVYDEASLSRAIELAVADALGVTDERLIIELYRLATDALVVADEAVAAAARTLIKLLDEALAVSDYSVSQLLATRELLDAVAVVDERWYDKLVSASDVITPDDAFLQRELYRGLLDSIEPTDATATARSLTRLGSDLMELFDEVVTSVTGLQVRLAGDQLEITDEASRVLLRLSLLSDELGTTAEVLRAVSLLRQADDQAAVSDQAWRELLATRGDSIELADLRAYELLKWLEDALVLSDSILAAQAREIIATAGDALEVGDGRVWELLRLVSEAVVAADEALAAKVQEAQKLVEDTLAVYDGRYYELLKALSDAIALDDQATAKATRLFLLTLDDPAVLDDSRLVALHKLMQEAVEASDSFLGGAVRELLKTSGDTIEINDLRDAVKVQGRDAAALIADLLDAALVERARNIQLDDPLPAVDDTRLALLRFLMLSEAFEISDESSSFKMLTRSAFDVFDITDDKLGLFVPDAARKLVWHIRVGARPGASLGYDAVVAVGSSLVSTLGYDPVASLGRHELPIQLGGFQ